MEHRWTPGDLIVGWTGDLFRRGQYGWRLNGTEEHQLCLPDAEVDEWITLGKAKRVGTP